MDDFFLSDAVLVYCGAIVAIGHAAVGALVVAGAAGLLARGWWRGALLVAAALALLVACSCFIRVVTDAHDLAVIRGYRLDFPPIPRELDELVDQYTWAAAGLALGIVSAVAYRVARHRRRA